MQTRAELLEKEHDSGAALADPGGDLQRLQRVIYAVRIYGIEESNDFGPAIRRSIAWLRSGAPRLF